MDTIFGCGCTFHPEPDVNGIAPWLVHCRRHAAAPEMRASLVRILKAHERGEDLTGWFRVTEVGNVRALLARVEGT